MDLCRLTTVFKLELVQSSADSSCLAYGDAVPSPKLRAQPKPGPSFLSGVGGWGGAVGTNLGDFHEIVFLP